MKEIFHRVSVRKFEDRAVESDKVEQILRAAMAAPSAGNQQPWDFYVVTSREKLHALAQVSPYAECPPGHCGCLSARGLPFPPICAD